MTPRNDASPRSDRAAPDRRGHSARIALIALDRREEPVAIDRDVARRLTVARLRAGTML